MDNDSIKEHTEFTTDELIEYYSYSYMQDLIDDYYYGVSKKEFVKKTNISTINVVLF